MSATSLAIRMPSLRAPPPCAVPALACEAEVAEALRVFLARHRPCVLTGAGISTASGIPDYRDASGQWKRGAPITWQQYLADPAFRARYWRRSYAGWPVVEAARPNAAHRALAQWQLDGRIGGLVTQNVDGLHQRAGASEVLDLHGRIDTVACLACGERLPRTRMQAMLATAHPRWTTAAEAAPDGDAQVDDIDAAGFHEPPCPRCGGLLKPDVVFFGENVPAVRVQRVHAMVEAADALLVIGSSLVVYSGYRIARAAAQAGKPVALLTRGVTRADPQATHKWDVDCAVLARVADQ